MFENILISIAVTFAAGFPLSIYAGVIVARYYAFLTALNQARTIVLNLEPEWNYNHLPEKIPDVSSSTGWRSIYFSDDVAGNHNFWKLIQIGLDLKEQDHWSAAQIVDAIAFEIEGIRNDFIQMAEAATSEVSVDLTAHLADWHRQLSRTRPSPWTMFRPWPRKRYEHISCVSVDEATGEWEEQEPFRE